MVYDCDDGGYGRVVVQREDGATSRKQLYVSTLLLTLAFFSPALSNNFENRGYILIKKTQQELSQAELTDIYCRSDLEERAFLQEQIKQTTNGKNISFTCPAQDLAGLLVNAD